LPVTSPFKEARLSTYGFRDSPAFHQELWITLAGKTPATDVIDVSIFGVFRPGMTIKEAVTIAGEPNGKRLNRYDENIYMYKQSQGVVELTCQVPRSTFSGSQCFWYIWAVPKRNIETIFMNSQFDQFLSKARSVPESIEYRAFHVNSEGSSEFITVTLQSHEGQKVQWGDRDKMRYGKEGE
jgi:hypothetical protein